jgi:signal peptidase I
MSFFKRLGTIFLDVLETVVIALAIFVIIYLFLFQPHQVRGNSMYPNFHDADYLLTDKISYRLSQPKRDDVVIFVAPKNEEYDYIKRVIALPGEKVSINDSNQVLVENQIVDETYLPEDTKTYGGNFLEIGGTVTVPDNQYFVLGDNRSHSSDSRDWGFVPKENLVGKAWFRYWPLDRMGLVARISNQEE